MDEYCGFEGDSSAYELLEKYTKIACQSGPGPCVEVGVRLGMGSAIIMDSMQAEYMVAKPNKDGEIATPRLLISIDPYGGLPYHMDDSTVHEGLHYEKWMKIKAMTKLIDRTKNRSIDIVHLQLTSGEYAKRFGDYYPEYRMGMEIRHKLYSFVHLDGQHQTDIVSGEFKFFGQRMQPGGIIVIDDYQKINIDKVRLEAIALMFRQVESLGPKIVFQRRSL